jgi:predicted DNA-binding transcriptional regulator AlpA
MEIKNLGMTTKIITQLLRNLADNIDAGNTNASEEELLEMCDYLGFITNPEGKISKYQAVKFLGVSRATFDNYVAKGLIPKGMKQQGFNAKF